MGRPRKHDKGLPAYVRIVNGSYHYRGRKLCRVEDGEGAMYEALAQRKAMPAIETVPAAVAAFKLDYLPRLSPSSRKEHARLLDLFADEFEEFRVDQVRAHHIKKAAMALFANAPTARRHWKARVSTFFRWAISDKGLLQINPCKEVWLERPIARKTPWTPELFWRVRDELEPMQQCYHDLSFLLYQRTTDVRLLRRERVDRINKTIHFAPTKTLRSSGKEVAVPITPAIEAVLDRAESIAREMALKKKRAIGPFVIQTAHGTAYTRSGIHSAYRRADEKLHGKDILHLNPKALRPFAATEAKKRGFSNEQLQVGLAHTTISTTEGYIQAHEVPVSEVTLTLPERPKGA